MASKRSSADGEKVGHGEPAERVTRARGSEAPLARAGRGRPSRSRLAEIETTILKAAQRQFLAQGFAPTSMEAIAAEAGVAKNTLYSRYPSKRKLFEAIAADRLRAWSALAPGPDEREIEGLEARLLHRATTVLDSISRPEIRAFERLLNLEARRFPALAAEFYERGWSSITRHIAEDIDAAAAEAGTKPKLDAAAVAAIFVAAIIGWFRVESTVRDVGKAERQAYGGKVVALCMAGLGL